MKRKVAFVALKSLLFVGFFSTLLQHNCLTAQAEETIRIGISRPSPGFLPTFIAEKKGFYAKYGLSSQHIAISLAIAMNALLTGDLDYAVRISQPVSAAIKGLPVKLVMMTQDKVDSFMMVRPGIEKVTDLAGGRLVGISYPGSTSQSIAEAILLRHGLVPGKDVHLLRSGDDMGRLAALEAGRVDAVVGSPPLNIYGSRKGYKVLVWARDYVALPQNAVIVADKKLQQSPDQVKRMIKATIEALQFIREQKQESIDILQKWMKMDRDTASGTFESVFRAYSADGTMTDEKLQAAIEESLKGAQSDKKVPVSQIADRRLLLEAQKELRLK
jgi:ABC-type nitrate/sulfonate/bicarbonate transport system substrate-binding protein